MANCCSCTIILSKAYPKENWKLFFNHLDYMHNFGHFSCARRWSFTTNSYCKCYWQDWKTTWIWALSAGKHNGATWRSLVQQYHWKWIFYICLSRYISIFTFRQSIFRLSIFIFILRSFTKFIILNPVEYPCLGWIPWFGWKLPTGASYPHFWNVICCRKPNQTICLISSLPSNVDSPWLQ